MTKRLRIPRVDGEFTIGELRDARWRTADAVVIPTYWSGEIAPESRHFKASLLWSDSSLYVRFEASRGEELVISDQPDLQQKTLGLWDRDVCEIFIAPDRENAGRYYEFEVAPTGEWVDLAVEWSHEGKKTDTSYRSSLKAAAVIETGRIVMSMQIGWDSFGSTPQQGDIWLGNIFRCVGRTPDRGYLAWQPTETEVPNFHVPGRFGEFEFMP
jgi:alpha-galactosidase